MSEGLIWKELQDTAEYVPSMDIPDIKVTDSMSFFDPRLSGLGARVICPEDSLDIETPTINIKDSSEDYDIIRLLYCVPEGPDEVKDAFPLNLNFHLLNSISFNKGCYIGQELTQRTYHTGVIRKMAMPFVCGEKLIFTIGDEESGNYEICYIIFSRKLSRACSYSFPICR